MKLTVLGSGDAFGSGGRNHTSFLLSEGGEHVLIDCGASTLIQLKKHQIELSAISTIIITHFHGDHFGGLPFFLISSMFEYSRKSPLNIIGPGGVGERVPQLLELMYPGTSEKLIDLDLTFCEYRQGTDLNIEGKTIQVQQVEHSPPSMPHGIRLSWKDKIFAFSGDTSWTDNLISLSNQADLFICECNFLDRATSGHLSYTELLDRSPQFTCKQLWLNHMSGEVIDASNFRLNRLKDNQIIEF